MKTIKNPNRNGRPAKGAAEKKAYKVSLKMATEEYYSLKSKARVAGMSRSEYIRQCIRTSTVKQRLLPEHLTYIRQLSGMANNVNQLAHKAHVSGYGEIHNQCMAMIAELDKLISQIGQ